MMVNRESGITSGDFKGMAVEAGCHLYRQRQQPDTDQHRGGISDKRLHFPSHLEVRMDLSSSHGNTMPLSTTVNAESRMAAKRHLACAHQSRKNAEQDPLKRHDADAGAQSAGA